MGIAGSIDGVKINVGSRKFVMGREDETKGFETRVYVFMKDKVLGYFQLENRYRSGLKEVISDLNTTYDLHLLTGDNEAERVNLIPLFASENQLHFNQSPHDKLNYIKQLKSSGKTVLMIGDGLNDAGALQQSDAGISITENINLFTPASDAILSANRFSLLPDFLRFSKLSLNIIVASFVLSFLYNLVGLFFAIQGALSPLIAAILMPISSISVIVFTTGASRLLAKHIFKEKSE